jgi:hypothetical protein
MSKSQYNLAPPSPTTLASVLSTAHTNPRATIATENNVIYSPCIATEVGGKEEKQVDSEI